MPTSTDLVPFIGNLTAPGLLGLGILLILFGRLVPRSTMIGRLEDKDTIIARQGEYIQVLKENNELLRRGTETTLSVVNALPPVAGVPGQIPGVDTSG
jgi:hypothetical protein